MMNLLDEEAGLVLSGVMVGMGTLCLGFFPFTLIHGLSVFWARRSFSWAVPYFSNLAGHLLASSGWSCGALLLPRQLRHLVSCGHRPSSMVSIVSPASRAVVHLLQVIGSAALWSFSSWSPLHNLQCCVSLHWCVGWSSLQQFRHWVTGGQSWNALTEQWQPYAARDLWLRMFRARYLSVVAKTREDLGVVISSSSERSHLGLATNEFIISCIEGCMLEVRNGRVLPC